MLEAAKGVGGRSNRLGPMGAFFLFFFFFWEGEIFITRSNDNNLKET
jgi:hypothetical protein